MPKYNYTAIDMQNKRISSFAEVRDEATLRKSLRDQNLIPIKISQQEEKTGRRRFKANELADFSRQLSGMLGSGITATRCVEILKNRPAKPHVKAVYERLYNDLQMGNTLAQAMTYQKVAFPDLLVNMYSSGEVSGRLEAVTEKMADHYDKEHRLNSKIKSAMMYPAILSVVAVVAVMFIFTAILPQFFETFEGLEIPAMTQVVLGISRFLQHQWYVLIVVAILLFGISRYLLLQPKVRDKFDELKLKFPLIGKLLVIIYTGRFARTLSSLYTSGVTMLRALEISSSIINNAYVEGQFPEVIKNVRNGMTLSEAVGKVVGLDRKLIDMIATGEETGRLDTMLDSVATAFDHESEMASLRLVQLIEPAFIIIIAGVIGFVLIAVMVPLMNYSDLVESQIN